jgi:SAM-dependent methyltransferase
MYCKDLFAAAASMNQNNKIENANSNNQASTPKSFDARKTISLAQARSIYDNFALSGHVGGKDASSGYGGPAVNALVSMADFGKRGTDEESMDPIYEEVDEDTPMSDDQKKALQTSNQQRVFDYGCGQGKLAELVANTVIGNTSTSSSSIHWHGVDQSPEMVLKFNHRFRQDGNQYYQGERFFQASCDLIKDGNPLHLLPKIPAKSYDRFISTYCLDLLCERDMYDVLTLAEHILHPKGTMLLAGITYGYRDSFPTFCMTLAWEIMYRIRPDIVGGCRPQCLVPYLHEKGWEIERIERTMPMGFPWMVSEVISARPPQAKNNGGTPC